VFVRAGRGVFAPVDLGARRATLEPGAAEGAAKRSGRSLGLRNVTPVDAAPLVAGGAAGSWLGTLAGQALAGRRGLLERGFAVFLLAVAAFVFARAW
jgi:hypothetical protein